MENSLFDIKGFTILVSGATGVLCSKMARYLALQGAEIHLLARNKEKGKALQQSIQQQGGRAILHIADVKDKNQLHKVADNLQKKITHLDVLINGAGGNQKGATIQENQSLEDLNESALEEVMKLNYQGTLLPCQAFLPLLRKSPHASVINLSSMAAIRPLTRVLGYGSAKAAINQFTQWLAVELARKKDGNIRVNAIAPGFFLTEQNKELLTLKTGDLSERGKKIIEHTPMDRFGDPEDLLGTVHWLCSPASSFITGIIIPVDGGFSAFSGV